MNWKTLQDHLFAQQMQKSHVDFTSTDLADQLGISGAEASAIIQDHLRVQRTQNTLCVLSRKGRTSSAVWHAGHRYNDAKHIHQQLVEDLKRRVERAVLPDLGTMGDLNPRSRRLMELTAQQIGLLVEMAEAQLEQEEEIQQANEAQLHRRGM